MFNRIVRYLVMCLADIWAYYKMFVAVVRKIMTPKPESSHYYFFGETSEAIPSTHIGDHATARDASYVYYIEEGIFAAMNESLGTPKPLTWLAAELQTDDTTHDITDWLLTLKFSTLPPTIGHIFALYRLHHRKFIGPSTRLILMTEDADEHTVGAGDAVVQ